MDISLKSLMLYCAKCVVGVLLVFGIAHVVNYTDIGWCLISIVLVLSPDSREAIPLAMTRMKANMTGGVASFCCLLLGSPEVFTLSLAFVLTIALCSVFKVMTGARSALAAAIIVILHGTGNPVWAPALERVLSVIVGCLLGLLITFVFHRRQAEKLMQPMMDGE